MIPALDDDRRESLLRLAAMLVLGSLCVLPMTVPGNGIVRAEGVAAPSASSEPEVPRDLPSRSVTLRRDPFMPIGAGAARGDVAMPLVRALALGPHPRALIDWGGAVSVYGAGDRLGTSVIARIDADGVELSNGMRLPVVQAGR